MIAPPQNSPDRAPSTVQIVPHAMAVRIVVMPDPARVAIALDTSFAPLANDIKNKSTSATRM